MLPAEILRRRLAAQGLDRPSFASPADAVRFFLAVQSQDYGGAGWAVGQRVSGTTETSFAAAFARGEILRTHVMRPTWHFVAPDDIGWLLEVTRDRLLQASGYQYRQYGLTESVLGRTDDIIQKAVEGNRHLTRAQLADRLAAEGVDAADTICLAHIVSHAEAMGLVCSGAPQGKQQTYALLAERAPGARTLDREAALAELARRFFAGHGPATLDDFTWWSGLTKTDAKAGLDSVKGSLERIEADDQDYWHAPIDHIAPGDAACLLPNYDEYVVAYADRAPLFDQRHTALLDSRQNPLFNNLVIVRGVIAGTWKKTLRRSGLTVALTLFGAASSEERAAIAAAAERCRAYFGAAGLTVEGLEGKS